MIFACILLKVHTFGGAVRPASSFGPMTAVAVREAVEEKEERFVGIKRSIKGL